MAWTEMNINPETAFLDRGLCSKSVRLTFSNAVSEGNEHSLHTAGYPHNIASVPEFRIGRNADALSDFCLPILLVSVYRARAWQAFGRRQRNVLE